MIKAWIDCVLHPYCQLLSIAFCKSDSYLPYSKLLPTETTAGWVLFSSSTKDNATFFLLFNLKQYLHKPKLLIHCRLFLVIFTCT